MRSTKFLRNSSQVVKEWFAILITFVCLHLFLLLWICRQRCPYSTYFGLSNEKAVQVVYEKQIERAKDAENYLEKLVNGTEKQFYLDRLNKRLDVLIVVTTVARKGGFNYLSRTFAAVDSQIRAQKGLEGVGFVICNAELDPQNHFELQKLAHFVPVFELGNKTRHFKTLQTKETLDYKLCLSLATKSLKILPDTILIMEDDTETLPGGLKRLVSAYDKKLRNRNDWAYVKLFHPDSFKGFELTWQSVFLLIFISFVLSVLSMALLLCLFRRKRPLIELLSTWALILANIVILCLLVNRQYTYLPLVHYILPYRLQVAPGIYTQAVMFKTNKLDHVISHIGKYKESHIDFILRDFTLEHHQRRHSDLKSFYIEGRFFKHIGFISSLSGNFRDQPWEFFE